MGTSLLNTSVFHLNFMIKLRQMCMRRLGGQENDWFLPCGRTISWRLEGAATETGLPNPQLVDVLNGTTTVSLILTNQMISSSYSAMNTSTYLYLLRVH